jgi:DNA-binding transcriptional regulator YdaS (Cro superfamily)
MNINPIVQRAIDLAGGQTALARLIGGKIRQQHVRRWLHMKRVPAERAVQIEIATNGAVSRSELRPDLWPKETETQPEKAA